jgi:hypothetical protein
LSNWTIASNFSEGLANCRNSYNAAPQCTNVEAYDGTGAPSVDSVKNAQPEVFPTILPNTVGAKVLFKADCNGNMYFAPSFSKLRMKLSSGTLLADLFKTVVLDNMKPMQECRATARGGVLSSEQFYAYYGMVQSWLYNYVRPAPAAVPLPAQSTILNLLFPFSQSGREYIILPDTCSYASWLATGECAIRFDGLSALIGSDIEIRVYMRKCPSSEVPTMYAECVGSGCDYFDVKPCIDSSTCPANGMCTDIASFDSTSSFNRYISTTATWYAGPSCTGSVLQTFTQSPMDTGCIILSNATTTRFAPFFNFNGNNDEILQYTGCGNGTGGTPLPDKYSGKTVCLSIPDSGGSMKVDVEVASFWEVLTQPFWDSYGLSQSSLPKTCYSRERSDYDVKALVDYLADVVPPVTSRNAFVCYPKSFTSSQFSQWYNSLFSASGNTIFSSSIKSWAPRADPNGSGNSATSIKMGWTILVLVIIGLVQLF